MDFDSPDVAKDFPGLARALSSNADYEEKEKGKDKKKKDKKDKDKGYATLAGESSPDEDELGNKKSPVKGLKIKSFKITSSKKKSEKDKEGSEKDKKKTPPPTASSSLSTKVDKTDKNSQILQKRKSSECEIPKPSTSSRPSLPSSTLNIISSNTTNSEKKGGLNVFLNAPVPLLLKKKESKEKIKKEEKKQESLASSASAKIKIMKLKRGSKSSLDESGTQAGERMGSPSHHLLPEDPELILKEIRKYETLLESMHAQVKPGKKVSKKIEEQLWELQRTLTQLKRKLRSINALSASFASPPRASINSTQITQSIENNTKSSALATKSSQESDINIEKQVSTSKKLISSIPLQKDITLDLTPISISDAENESSKEPNPTKNTITTFTKIEAKDSEVKDENNKSIELSSIPKESEILKPNLKEVAIELKSNDTIQDDVKINISPNDKKCSEAPKTESLQVSSLAQVHLKLQSESHTPEEFYEKEISSFGTLPAENYAKTRENVKILQKSLENEEDVEVNSSCSSPDSSQNDGTDDENETNGIFENREEEEESLVHQSSRSCSSEDEEEENRPIVQTEAPIFMPAFKVVQAPPIFDPFSLPLFKTDHFVAVENEALISFNLQLQDDIVKEEEEIERLMTTMHELNLDKNLSISSDVEELDDDELVNLWQNVKFENDHLNEQMMNLKSIVAHSRLEEFRLETRLKYLQEHIFGKKATRVVRNEEDEDYLITEH